MDRLIGTDVEVHLKSNDVISGTLFDVEDSYVYIQKNVSSFITVPKENIKYYVSRSFQDKATAMSHENNSEAQGRVLYDTSKTSTSTGTAHLEADSINAIEVFVDEVYIISIPVIPTIDLSTFNDNIMRIVVRNPDVQMALANRTQKVMRYAPGKVMFITNEGSDAPMFNEPNSQPTSSADSFTMGGGNPATSFAGPSQMVARLNQVVQEKKNE